MTKLVVGLHPNGTVGWWVTMESARKSGATEPMEVRIPERGE
jgi:hypothetical protein